MPLVALDLPLAGVGVGAERLCQMTWSAFATAESRAATRELSYASALSRSVVAWRSVARRRDSS